VAGGPPLPLSGGDALPQSAGVGAASIPAASGYEVLEQLHTARLPRNVPKRAAA
jgi:hypothetical protein